MCDVCFLLFCLLRSSWWSAFLPGLSSLLPSDQWFPSLCVYGIHSFLIHKNLPPWPQNVCGCACQGQTVEALCLGANLYSVWDPRTRPFTLGQMSFTDRKSWCFSWMISKLSGVRKWARSVGSFRLNLFGFFLLRQGDHGWGFCFLCSEVSQLPWWAPRWMR